MHQWFHKRERGVFSGIMGVMISTGYFLALVVGGWIYEEFPLYVLFMKPAIAFTVFTLLVAVVVKDTPEEAGLVVPPELHPTVSSRFAAERDRQTGTNKQLHDRVREQKDKRQHTYMHTQHIHTTTTATAANNNSKLDSDNASLSLTQPSTLSRRVQAHKRKKIPSADASLIDQKVSKLTIIKMILSNKAILTCAVGMR